MDIYKQYLHTLGTYTYTFRVKTFNCLCDIYKQYLHTQGHTHTHLHTHGHLQTIFKGRNVTVQLFYYFFQTSLFSHTISSRRFSP